MKDSRQKGGRKHSSFVVKAVEEQSEQAKEEEIIANLNRQAIHRYLQGLGAEPNNQQMANRIIKDSANKLLQGFKEGVIEIAQSPPPLPEKGEGTSLRLSSQEMRELQSKAKRQAISKKIEYLYGQIRGACETSGNLQVDFKEVLSKEEHERRVREVQAEKEQRRKRMEELQAEEERRRREEEERREALRAMEEEKGRERKRRRIEETIRKREEQHKSFLEMQHKLQSQYISAKNKTRLYEQMQKKYQSQVLLPSLQQRKEKLKEIRDFHMRYDVKTIRQHEQSYLSRSKDRPERGESGWKYSPPQRSARLEKALRDQEAHWQQELVMQRQKVEEMQKRQEVYAMELREKHRPKVDEDKRKEIEVRLIQEKRKYEKTHPNIDHRRIGEAYLEMAKRMKRRAESVPTPKEEISQEQLKSTEKKEGEDSRVKHTQEFYQENRRKRIDKIIDSDEASLTEKCMMLKMESDKLAQKLRQKEEILKCQPNEEVQGEAGELLLSSIKAKMGIMSLMGGRRGSESDESV